MDAYSDAYGAKRPDKVDLTPDIVAAYVSNNRVLPAELLGILAAVHAALVRSGQGGTIRKLTAAATRKSVTREALISFEDGKPYKTLKRHLDTLGLSLETYREKWELPPDYPLVAASHSAQRSATAKRIGLGRPARTGAPRLFLVAGATLEAPNCTGTMATFAATAACIPSRPPSNRTHGDDRPSEGPGGLRCRITRPCDARRPNYSARSG